MTTPHKRAPEHSRQRLIEAVLDCIAEDGITDTTVSTIIRRAGLSRGMIHLHFGGKDNLLAAAAETFAAAYYATLEADRAQAPDDPAKLILALIQTDLGPAQMNERSVRIWHAFRGASQSNPQIARYSDTRDGQLRDLYLTTFRILATREKPDDTEQLARDATFGTLAMMEGMWIDYMTHTDRFDRDQALRTIRRFLAGLFPKSFS